MNKTDRWISQCSCGVNTMQLHRINEGEQEYLLKRRGHSAMLEDSNWHDSFMLKEPFEHIDGKHFPGGRGLVDRLDPIISGLVLYLLKMDIPTISSCQGRQGYSPYIYTYANQEQLAILSSLFYNEDGWRNHWNNVLINFEDIRHERAAYLIQFYDKVSVLHHYKKFTGLNPFEIPENIFVYDEKA